MTRSCDVHWHSGNKFQQTTVIASTVKIFNCHSCTVSGMLLKSLLDIILTRIPWRTLFHEVKTKTVVNALRLYLFALSLRRLRRLRVSLFHFNEWTISVSWITLAKASDDALRWQGRWRECAETKLDLQSGAGRLTKDEKNDTAREIAVEGFVWHKGEKPGGERNKPKKGPFVPRPIMKLKWCVNEYQFKPC